MEQYLPIDKKALTPDRKKMVLGLGLVVVVLGIIDRQWLWLVCGVLLVAVSFFTKDTRITATGISLTYHIAFYTRYDGWAFSEIEAIHAERDKVPGQVALHFTRGAMNRRLIFTAADAGKVVQLAKRANPNIYFDDAH